jgi:hypothetical protein
MPRFNARLLGLCVILLAAALALCGAQFAWSCAQQCQCGHCSNYGCTCTEKACSCATGCDCPPYRSEPCGERPCNPTPNTKTCASGGCGAGQYCSCGTICKNASCPAGGTYDCGAAGSACDNPPNCGCPPYCKGHARPCQGSVTCQCPGQGAGNCPQGTGGSCPKSCKNYAANPYRPCGGAKNCGDSAAWVGCDGEGCGGLCGYFCPNAAYPCEGAVHCSNATYGCKKRGNDWKNCQCTPGYDCGNYGDKSDGLICPRWTPTCDNGGWCCGGCEESGRVYTGCTSPEPGGYPWCETAGPPNYIHCRCGYCSCEVAAPNLCKCTSGQGVCGGQYKCSTCSYHQLACPDDATCRGNPE